MPSAWFKVQKTQKSLFVSTESISLPQNLQRQPAPHFIGAMPGHTVSKTGEQRWPVLAGTAWGAQSSTPSPKALCKQ